LSAPSSLPHVDPVFFLLCDRLLSRSLAFLVRLSVPFSSLVTQVVCFPSIPFFFFLKFFFKLYLFFFRLFLMRQFFSLCQTILLLSCFDLLVAIRLQTLIVSSFTCHPRFSIHSCIFISVVFEAGTHSFPCFLVLFAVPHILLLRNVFQNSFFHDVFARVVYR